MNAKPTNRPDATEPRRSTTSRRRMTRVRRLYYFVGLPLMRGLIKVLGWTYRFEPVIGAENFEPFVTENKVCAPVHWHQHHILGSYLMRSWIRRGFKVCVLVSGSVDGEVPERMARAWGAEVIRGSANKTGTLALRDQQRMMKSGYSIMTSADGPRGPRYELKAGIVLMARIAGIPLVPIGCAATNAWYLNRWDAFMIPKPFSRVAIAIGEPIPVPEDLPLDRLEPIRQNVQEAVMSLMRDSEEALKPA